MSEEAIVASPEMQKFFQNLLDLKGFVQEKAEATQLDVLKEIYDKLNTIIKEGA